MLRCILCLWVYVFKNAFRPRLSFLEKISRLFWEFILLFLELNPFIIYWKVLKYFSQGLQILCWSLSLFFFSHPLNESPAISFYSGPKFPSSAMSNTHHTSWWQTPPFAAYVVTLFWADKAAISLPVFLADRAATKSSPRPCSCLPLPDVCIAWSGCVPYGVITAPAEPCHAQTVHPSSSRARSPPSDTAGGDHIIRADRMPAIQWTCPADWVPSYLLLPSQACMMLCAEPQRH